eukprot:7232007-Karenia_brevis.AAC.1
MKFALAGHVARRSDLRWSYQALMWMPCGTRKPAHPFTRWVNSLDDFAETLPFEPGEWTCL